jgi:ATP-dependent Clp protease ATP-binding subunit ClpB
VDFRNALVIMTSNLGSELWQNQAGPVTRDTINRILQAHFRPEFLNRIDEVVVFHSLTRADLTQIVEIQLKKLVELLAERGLMLEVSQAAREYLADSDYAPEYGARPLKRAIQRELQDPLAMKVLTGDFHPGDLIKVDRGPDGLSFSA